ncbi:LAGLIDADG family homing endonuclease [Brevibacillus choshinensis]|uniref:LAGLIDADG family homing endonuclease n=1 Tax=Brevibacillus choshinensis TaxID=54911 RepID=UPI002E1C6234|nr:LAGLIDADG family homing endonuclease [Brevibacillus choshinensis]MED4781004.1 LAGLIDADG family homing endonuclease [Brevibacillus choshinensis]
MERIVHNNTHKSLTDEEIISMYLNQISPKVIAEKANLSDRSIRRIMKRHGYETKNAGKPRKYGVNENFFKVWSPEMAYVLGMIVTDGCVYSTIKYRKTFDIVQADIKMLEKLKKVMCSEQPIYRYDTTCSAFRLVIGSSIMVDDLLELGVQDRKSHTIKAPAVPTEYLNHFIRGVFDGDGWIHKRAYTMNITSASEEFAHFIYNTFVSLNLNTRIYTDTSGRKTTVYRVFVSGKNDIITLALWLYKESGDLYLERKKKLFYQNFTNVERCIQTS